MRPQNTTETQRTQRITEKAGRLGDRFPSRSKAGVHSAHGRAHLRGEELSLYLDARHLSRNERQPRGSLSLLSLERRTAVSDSGQLLRPRARTTRAAVGGGERSGRETEPLH